MANSAVFSVAAAAALASDGNISTDNSTHSYSFCLFPKPPKWAPAYPTKHTLLANDCSLVGPHLVLLLVLLLVTKTTAE